MNLDFDGDETAVAILAVDLAIHELLSEVDRLEPIRQKLESSQKPFQFTPEELTALRASLDVLQDNERGRGFGGVLDRVRSTIAEADK